MNQLPLAEVLPISASVNDAGRLAIQNLDVREIVGEFGSPLYIFDEATIREMCREFVGNFRRFYPTTDIEYSTKAFSNPAILKIMEEEGMSIDVVTGGELAFALAVDFPPRKSTSTVITRRGTNYEKRSRRASVASRSIRSTRLSY